MYYNNVSKDHLSCRTDSVRNTIVQAMGPQMSQRARLAVDFIEACLKMGPSDRITAVEALQHPFLRDIEPAIIRQRISPLDLLSTHAAGYMRTVKLGSKYVTDV